MKDNMRDWEPDFLESLRNPETAKAYIENCLQEGIPFQVAVGDVIRAQGISKVAKITHLAKPNVIRAIRPKANPTMQTMLQLLHAIGFDFSVRNWTAKPSRSHKKAAVIAR